MTKSLMESKRPRNETHVDYEHMFAQVHKPSCIQLSSSLVSVCVTMYIYCLLFLIAKVSNMKFCSPTEL